MKSVYSKHENVLIDILGCTPLWHKALDENSMGKGSSLGDFFSYKSREVEVCPNPKVVL